MLKIGVFASMAQVSIKCLRHYDDIGLLRPVEVDRTSGYRYYSVDQLPRLHRILALKDLGFSLEEITQLIDAPLSNVQLREMLKSRQSELERRVREEQERLARLEAHLQLMDSHSQAPSYDVILKSMPSQLVASLPQTYQVGEPIVMFEPFDEVRTYLRHENVRQSGPEFSLWHSGDEERQCIEAVFPLSAPVTESRRVQVYELPGGHMATTMHRGRHSTTWQAAAATLRWMEANGYRANGPSRAVYHHCDKSGQADSVVEVQFPVVKATPKVKTPRVKATSKSKTRR